jgi:hypothetical protein
VGRFVCVVLLSGFVDPCGCGQGGRFRVLADEPSGVAGVGGAEDLRADRLSLFGLSIVDVARCVPSDD